MSDTSNTNDTITLQKSDFEFVKNYLDEVAARDYYDECGDAAAPADDEVTADLLVTFLLDAYQTGKITTFDSRRLVRDLGAIYIPEDMPDLVVLMVGSVFHDYYRSFNDRMHSKFPLFEEDLIRPEEYEACSWSPDKTCHVPCFYKDCTLREKLQGNEDTVRASLDLIDMIFKETKTVVLNSLDKLPEKEKYRYFSEISVSSFSNPTLALFVDASLCHLTTGVNELSSWCAIAQTLVPVMEKLKQVFPQSKYPQIDHTLVLPNLTCYLRAISHTFFEESRDMTIALSGYSETDRPLAGNIDNGAFSSVIKVKRIDLRHPYLAKWLAKNVFPVNNRFVLD